MVRTRAQSAGRYSYSERFEYEYRFTEYEYEKQTGLLVMTWFERVSVCDFRAMAGDA